MTDITYECPICLNIHNLGSLFFVSHCDHIFFRNCLNAHCTDKINENITDVKCPLCNNIILYNDLLDILNDDVMIKKLDNFLYKKGIRALGDMTFCPKCDTICYKGVYEKTRVVCTNNKCRYDFCHNCYLEWHDDYTCEQYKENIKKWKTDENIAFIEYLQSNDYRLCTKCNYLIKWVAGCENIICGHCKSNLNWNNIPKLKI